MNGIPNNFTSNNLNNPILNNASVAPHHPVVPSSGSIETIQNEIADIAQISSQAQEKPQATMPTIGTESQQLNKGIGSVIGNYLGGVNSESMEAMSTKSASSKKAKPQNEKPQDTKPNQAKPQDTKPNQAKPQDTKPNQAKPQNAKPNQEKPQSAWQGIVNLYHGVNNAVNTVSNAVNTVSDAYNGVVNTVSTVSHAVIDPIADVAQILEETTTVEGLTHPNSHHHNYEYNPETNSITVRPKK